MAIRMIVKKDGIEQSRVFRHSPVRLGRNPLNDLCIASRAVSQWHALIKFDDASISIVDLDSTNGTHIGERGKIVNASIKLQPDDYLRIANLTIAIRHATPEEIQHHDKLQDALTVQSAEPRWFEKSES